MGTYDNLIAQAKPLVAIDLSQSFHFINEII
jgi:hypothetical protein